MSSSFKQPLSSITERTTREREEGGAPWRKDSKGGGLQPAAQAQAGAHVCGGGGKGRAASDRGETTAHTMDDHHGRAHKGREKVGN